MQRITLMESGGAWFDLDKATEFREATKWDGNNSISVNTGSQWSHEMLLQTAGGEWILNRWSQADGSRETYELIWEKQAVAWLIFNGHEVLEGLAEIADMLEVK